jgi:hypothetical protein
MILVKATREFQSAWGSREKGEKFDYPASDPGNLIRDGFVERVEAPKAASAKGDKDA